MISIIIPVYNGIEYIQKCVQSVLAQSYSDFELLIIDDGSTDGSSELCDEAAGRDSRIRVIHQVNSGASAARNRGITEAHGEWLTFVDADDTLAPCALEHLNALTDDSVDAVFGGITGEKAFSGQTQIPPAADIVKDTGSAILDTALYDPTYYLTCHGWLLRTSVFRNHALSFNTALRLGEDGEMMMRFLVKARRAELSDRKVYRYSINRNSTIHRWKKGISEGYINTVSEAYNSVPEHGEGMAAYTLIHLLLILTHDTFHPENGLGFSAKLRACRELLDMPVFSKAFTAVEYGKFGFAKRATLLCLKHRLVFPAWIAVRVRQLQNSMRAS